MELKQDQSGRSSTTTTVLIVPSGIETRNKWSERGHLLVLIVPSGIETDYIYKA